MSTSGCYKCLYCVCLALYVIFSHETSSEINQLEREVQQYSVPSDPGTEFSLRLETSLRSLSPYPSSFTLFRVFTVFLHSLFNIRLWTANIFTIWCLNSKLCMTRVGVLSRSTDSLFPWKPDTHCRVPRSRMKPTEPSSYLSTPRSVSSCRTDAVIRVKTRDVFGTVVSDGHVVEYCISC